MSDLREATLTVGTVLPNMASVVYSRQLLQYKPGDGVYSTWIAACVRPGDNFHDYAVWMVVARPEGFYVCSGRYYHDLWDAVNEVKGESNA